MKSNSLKSSSLRTLAKGVIFQAPFYLIRFLCLVAFLTQTSTLINGMLNPKETLIGTHKVGFEKIEFPLIFKICIKPGFNDTELRNLGYRNSFSYLLGMSMFNESLFGWAGHTPEGDIVSNVSGSFLLLLICSNKIIQDVMTRATTNPWKYLDSIELNGKYGILEKMEYPNYPDNCWTFDVAKQTNHTPFFIRFTFNLDTKYSAEVHIEDRLVSLKRANAFAKFSTNGPMITNTDKKYKGYALEIEQEIFEEKEEHIGCRNYPTELFSSYYDCDRNYTQDWMKKYVSNLLPVWASKSINETTIHKTDVNREHWSSYVNFLIGMHRSDCPLPCKTTRISTR